MGLVSYRSNHGAICRSFFQKELSTRSFSRSLVFQATMSNPSIKTYGKTTVDWSPFLDDPRPKSIKSGKSRGGGNSEVKESPSNVPENVHVFYRSEKNKETGFDRKVVVAYVYDRESQTVFFRSCIFNSDGKKDSIKFSRASHRYTALHRLYHAPLEMKAPLHMLSVEDVLAMREVKKRERAEAEAKAAAQAMLKGKEAPPLREKKPRKNAASKPVTPQPDWRTLENEIRERMHQIKAPVKGQAPADLAACDNCCCDN